MNPKHLRDEVPNRSPQEPFNPGTVLPHNYMPFHAWWELVSEQKMTIFLLHQTKQETHASGRSRRLAPRGSPLTVSILDGKGTAGSKS